MITITITTPDGHTYSTADPFEHISIKFSGIEPNKSNELMGNAEGFFKKLFPQIPVTAQLLEGTLNP
jgi:hypothetical protein